MPRLLHVLLPLTAVAAVATSCQPAFAAWTTLAGTDPVVQVDRVCHDGADIDMGRWQVRDALVPSITAAQAQKYQQQHPLVAQVVVPTAPPQGDPGWRHIDQQTVTLPLDPQVIDEDSTDDAGRGTEHVLVGTTRFLYSPQTSGSTLRLTLAGSDAATDYVPMPMGDCFLNVVATTVGAASSTTDVAVLGNRALHVRTLTPSTFRVRATAPPSGVLFPPAPLRSRIADVNGDGVADLVLTVSSSGSGITTATTAASLTGRTSTGGSIAGSVDFGSRSRLSAGDDTSS